MTNDKNNQKPANGDETQIDARASMAHENPTETGDDASWGMFLFFAIAILVLLSLVFWPWTYRAINSIGVPAARQYIGTVQKITYVGGFGTHTQIDTETRTLLLRGVVILQKSDRLEERLGLMESDVCMVGTDQCWHLMGR